MASFCICFIPIRSIDFDSGKDRNRGREFQSCNRPENHGCGNHGLGNGISYKLTGRNCKHIEKELDFPYPVRHSHRHLLALLLQGITDWGGIKGGPY